MSGIDYSESHIVINEILVPKVVEHNPFFVRFVGVQILIDLLLVDHLQSIIQQQQLVAHLMLSRFWVIKYVRISS